MRTFACLVAQRPSSPSLLACVSLSLSRPEAILPAPFPTAVPFRCYISNMAVRPEARRQGTAAALLVQCERLAARWGFDSVWLHVEAGNAAAVGLYVGAGYREVGKAVGLTGKRLMRKVVVPMGKDKMEGIVEGATGKDGVFVWTVSSPLTTAGGGQSPEE